MRRAAALGILGIAFVAAGAVREPNPATLKAPAPEFTGRQWINTADGKPVSLESRHGKVTVVHFWTYDCINCRHNLPIYDRWHKQLAARNVMIIGIHTPETESERVRGNVLRRMKEFGIEYPVLLDPDLENWNRWRQQYWPAIYLVDKRGRVRYRWAGELNYGGVGGEQIMMRAIEALLAEPAP